MAKTIKKLPRKANSKVEVGTELLNSAYPYLNNYGPSTSPMSGVFDMGMGQGTSALSSQYEFFSNTSAALISLQRILLSYSYTLFGPLRTLVDQPVYDAFRGGIRIKTDLISPEEIEEVHKALKKLKVTKKVTNAMRWDRLFGGAGIILNTNQDYKQPFAVESIKQGDPIQFIVADRWELLWQGLPNAPKSTFAYYPGSGYSVEQVEGTVMDDQARFNISSIHQSRVFKIIGEEPPSLVRQRLQGWGMSIVECVIRELNQYFKENNVIFELLDEAKVDVWKIKGFNATMLSQIARGQTVTRIQLAQMMKNFLNAVTLDSEDDYEQKTANFAGLGEMLEQIRIGIASAIRMPMSKIFGLASSGFSSGEDDLQNYASIVELQREKAEEVLEQVIPVVMMSVLGMVPEDWAIEWKPVRTLKADELEAVKTAKFARALQMAQAGLLTPQEFMQYCQDEEIYTGESEVLEGAEPEPLMGAMMAGEGGEPGKPKSSKAPTEKASEG